MPSEIKVGIGGWTFPPWRGLFYPTGLRQKDELSFAARQLTAIEINGTYYSTFDAQSFAKWGGQTPDGFVFTIKASRFCTNRKVLADAGEAIGRFFAQGMDQLGDRLGPILWQFMPTKKFDGGDFAAFLRLLPDNLGSRRLRHVVEVRHDSFADPHFVALCRDRGVAICVADHETYPLIIEDVGDLVYARLMRGREEIETCYPPAEIRAWAGRLNAWSHGGPGRGERDVFAFFINGGKPRAPAGALALIEALRSGP